MRILSRLIRIPMRYGATLLGASVALGYLILVPAASAQVMDCRTVHCSRRAVCNLNVLTALNELKIGHSDRLWEGDQRHTAVAILQHQQELLRSFLYDEKCVSSPPPEPVCVSTPPRKPGFWEVLVQRMTRLLQDPPLFSSRLYADTGTICTEPPEGAAKKNCECHKEVEMKRADDTRNFLVGRWDGWQEFPDLRLTRVMFNIIRVTGSYVKACSDQGMVNGTIESDGSLVFPRLKPLDIDYRFKLWRVTGEEALSGSALLSLDRARDIVAGPVRISKKLEPADAEPVPDSCEEEPESFRVLR